MLTTALAVDENIYQNLSDQTSSAVPAGTTTDALDRYREEVRSNLVVTCPLPRWYRLLFLATTRLPF